MAAISSQFGAFNALANLHRAESGQNRSLERLSSGSRLTRSVDDPADFATSNEYRSEIKSTRDVRKTVFEGVNTIQLAESALDEGLSLIYRAMELAEASASDALGSDGGPIKAARDLEYQELLNTIDDINDNTRYNDQQLFGAAGISLTVNMDTNATATSQATIATQPFNVVALNLAGTDITTSANSDVVLSRLRPALLNMTRQMGSLGTVQNRMQRGIEDLNDRIDGFVTQESRIRDMDVAEEAVSLTTFQIQSQSGLAAIAQSNLSSESVLQLLG